MKISSSILAAMALLAVATLSSAEVQVDHNQVSNHAHVNDHSYSFQPPNSVKQNGLDGTKPKHPHNTHTSQGHKSQRALRSVDSAKQNGLESPKQKHPTNHQHHHHNTKSGHRALDEEVDSVQRALGHISVTPAPTITGNSRATPAPTTPKVTPAATTTKVTPAPTHPKLRVTPVPTHPTTTSSNSAKRTPAPKVTPAATKPTPAPTKPHTHVKVTPAPTKSKWTSTGKNSDATQQKTRNLGENQAKQQPQQQRPRDHKVGSTNPHSKDGKKHN